MCAVYDNNLKIIKAYISNLTRVTRFWNTLHQVRAKSEDWKANNAKVFDSKKTKGPTQDSQNRLCSPVPDGGEQAEIKINKYLRLMFNVIKLH